MSANESADDKQMNNKLRIIFDFTLKSKKKFDYEFKFVDVSKSNKKIDLDRLCEMLRKVLDDIESQGENKNCISYSSKSLH